MARIFSWFREYDLQRKKSMQESCTRKEEMRRQERMNTMADLTRTHQIKGQNGRDQMVGT